MTAQAAMHSKSPAYVRQDVHENRHDGNSPDHNGLGESDLQRMKSTLDLSCRGNGQSPRKSRPGKSEDGIIGALCVWVVEHQIGESLSRLDKFQRRAYPSRDRGQSSAPTCIDTYVLPKSQTAYSKILRPLVL